MPEKPSRSRTVAPRDPKGADNGEVREDGGEGKVRKPGTFTSESARKAAALRGSGHKPKPKATDDDIDRALRRKAAAGDVAAARELRERARVAKPLEEGASALVLDEMSAADLGRLRDRLLRMAVRFNARAAQARAPSEAPVPPRSQESRERETSGAAISDRDAPITPDVYDAPPDAA